MFFSPEPMLWASNHGNNESLAMDGQESTVWIADESKSESPWIRQDLLQASRYIEILKGFNISTKNGGIVSWPQIS